MNMDSQARKLILEETRRQKETLNLIASENYVSKDVRDAVGSVLSNKYSEGYPNRRYYSGNSIIDRTETLARNRAMKLFGLRNSQWGVNVQAYSGSPANFAVYSALVPKGKTIMGLSLDMGGHLTHGHKASKTSQFWKSKQYGVSKDSHLFDYEAIGKLARRIKPVIFVSGYTAHTRIPNFKKFHQIARDVGAIHMVDMSHFAGLVAGRVHPSPFLHADVVTSTTHKTLRGPRGALIFARKKYLVAINKAVFPGLQGGPHNNQTLGIAVALQEAAAPAFQVYAKRVLDNARALAEELSRRRWVLITGGTDNHQVLADVSNLGMTGGEAESILEEVGITVNKNSIPFDTQSPFNPSGIRMGTPAVSTRKFTKNDMKYVGGIIDETLRKGSKRELKKRVHRLLINRPL